MLEASLPSLFPWMPLDLVVRRHNSQSTVAASTRHHSHHDGEANHLSCCVRRVVAIRRHASSSTVRRPRFFFRANHLWLPINRAEPRRCAATTRQARALAALALARARATRWPHDGTAHYRPSPCPHLAHAAAASSPALPPRRSRASTLPLCTLTPSCHAVVLAAVRLAYKTERSRAELRHQPKLAELLRSAS